MATEQSVAAPTDYDLRTTCGQCGRVTTAHLYGALVYGSDADHCSGCGQMFGTDDESETFVEGAWRPTWWDNEIGGLVYDMDGQRSAVPA